MVKYVRRGHGYRAAARRWQVSLSTVARWVGRSRGQRLAGVCWQDRPSGAPRPNGRTPAQVVAAIQRARKYLQRHDALGEHGPVAIRQYLLAKGTAAPSARTIARWLARTGLSGKERWRRPAPPKGWYLAEVADGIAELDSCDLIEGLCLRGRGPVEVFNTVALWAGGVSTVVARTFTTPAVIAALQARWMREGRPGFLQCDNAPLFTGGHVRHTCFGRLVHWCLCVGVVPVFTPPAELGFQAAVEAYNRRWQDRVWRRWQHRNRAALHQRSDAFVAAYTARARELRGQPAPRQPWLAPGPQRRVHRIVLLRRLDAQGALALCGDHLVVSSWWAHRLVRCELDVHAQLARIYGLRRSAPQLQPLLHAHHLPLRLVPWHQAQSET